MGKKKKKIKNEIKDLVIYRLGLLPPDKKISMGSSGEFTKDMQHQVCLGNKEAVF